MGEPTPEGGGAGTDIELWRVKSPDRGFPAALLSGADIAAGLATRTARLAARGGAIGWEAGLGVGRRAASLPGGRSAMRVARRTMTPLLNDGREARLGTVSALENATGRLLETFLPGLVDALDIDGIAQRLEVDRLVGRIDVDALVSRIDIDRLVSRIDIDRLVSRIDIDRLVSRIDIDVLVSRIDIDKLVARIEIDEVVRRIQLDAMLGRIDIDELMARLDLDAIVDRIDVNEVVQRMDIDKVIEETELGAIVSRSTSGFATEALDAARNQTAGVDTIVSRAVNRVLRRRPGESPAGPPLLVSEGAAHTTPQPPVEGLPSEAASTSDDDG